MSVNPRWFHFFKEQVVPQAASIGSSWPRRKGLAEVVQGLGTYRYAYIYDRQFGTFIGAVGQSDPAVHATILGLAGHENPSQRVFAPFALATGWHDQEGTLPLIRSLADNDPNETVRYAGLTVAGGAVRSW